MTIKELEDQLLELAQPIDAFLNKDCGQTRKVGFLLCAFEFGVAGAPLAYLSNAQPDDLRRTLTELQDRLASTSRIVQR